MKLYPKNLPKTNEPSIHSTSFSTPPWSTKRHHIWKPMAISAASLCYQLYQHCKTITICKLNNNCSGVQKNTTETYSMMQQRNLITSLNTISQRKKVCIFTGPGISNAFQSQNYACFAMNPCRNSAHLTTG